MNFKEIDPKQIIEGWRNHFFPPKHLRELIKQVSAERLAVCMQCEDNSTTGRIGNLSHCKICGCPLKQKSKALHAECPVKKWVAVADVATSEQIIKEINEET